MKITYNEFSEKYDADPDEDDLMICIPPESCKIENCEFRKPHLYSDLHQHSCITSNENCPKCSIIY